MILADIITEFQSGIEHAAFWNTTRAATLANRAVRSIVRELNILLRAYTTLTTEADRQRYSVPVDYITNHLIWFNDSNNQEITMCDSPNEIYGIVADPAQTGKPEKAFIWNYEGREEVCFYYVPDDAYTIEWWYYCTPPKLVNNNDEPITPRFLDQYIIDFMERRAKVDDGLMSETEARSLFKLDVLEMKTEMGKYTSMRRKPSPANARRTLPTDRGGIISFANDGDYQWAGME